MKKKKLPPRTYEECLPIINICIEKRRYRWTLTALAYLDFDDIAQTLRLHIWKKWHLYDQSKNLESWLTTVINNQMINLMRNYYSNFSRPCLKCEFNEGGDLCSKFDTQSTKCDLYKVWVYGKKSAYDIKLPVSIENHQNEVFDLENKTIDVERSAEKIHIKMESILKPNEYKIYKWLFIEHKSEEEVGKLMKYRSEEKNRHPGYKQLKNIQKSIIAKIKDLINNGEIDISYQ